MQLDPSEVELALLARLACEPRRGLSYYDLKREIRAGRSPLAGRSVRSVANALKRLHDRQLIEASDVDPHRRGRVSYSLTDDGLRTLQRWARSASGSLSVGVNPELQVRLLLVHVVGAEATADALSAIADDLGNLVEELADERADVYVGGDVARKLEIDLRFELTSAHVGWLWRAVAELEALAAQVGGRLRTGASTGGDRA